MKRSVSKKSHSWWWDSHVHPKTSKWLADNLDDMDQSVKRMLKLIEEDGDSFAKKAEMYYKKRPELISHVEEFYRMYRSLAERYDHLTGELRKNIPTDLQSQGSGISEIVSEYPSAWPSPDQKLTRRKSGPRAAGFDVFLGPAGSISDAYQKEGDESSSLTDSEPESDCSSVNNYSTVSGNGGDQALNKRIIELEIELREVREKLQLQQDGSAEDSRNYDLITRIEEYEQELTIANEKTRLSEEELNKMRKELQKYESLEGARTESFLEKDQPLKPQERINPEEGMQDADGRIRALVDELGITKQKLQESQKEAAKLKLERDQSLEKVQILRVQLESAQKEIVTWKSKVNAEKREASKLQERISRLKTSLSDRDHEIRDLKIAVSDAEQKIFPEKAQIKAEISNLLQQRARLEEDLREWEARGRSLRDEIRTILNEKSECERRLQGEIEQMKVEIAEKGKCIKNLKEKLDTLESDREELNAKVRSLKGEVVCRDEQIDQMDKHLHQIHAEHVELMASAESMNNLVEELKAREKELEDEVERQRSLILEGAEEKREAIRQLCFSLEHYRNGYHRLRQAFMGHKRVAVLAS